MCIFTLSFSTVKPVIHFCMNTTQSIIIAIVEGITEFLPISSTGHMIITQKLLGMESSDFTNLFTVSIQFGAILSVVVLYWRKFSEPLNTGKTEGSAWARFSHTFDFYLKLFVAFLPAAFFGLLLSDYINTLLENVVVVAVSLVLGGIVLLFVDNWFKKPAEDQQVTYPKALKIGLFQVISMIPGVSRAAATIIGGLTQQLTRKNAAEFSFFLAVPTMLAASALELIKTYRVIDHANIKLLLLGNGVAFIVALLAIKGFIAFLTRYGFRVFGYYRIIIGTIILILLYLGYDLNMVG
jgi:undecaprenyl-diphosphatase